jgi:hypothetical protein
MTIATPCVVTLTNHGLRNGAGVVFTTTGALPTGVTSGTTYYARSTAANTFNLYDTAAHAIDTGSTTGRVNTSGSQSGTHTIKGAYFLGLTSGQLARYGSAGSERIYDGLAAWEAARSTAVPGKYDTEVCEVGEAYTDTVTTRLTITLPCIGVIVSSYVNGVRSSAFHNGVIGAGYVFTSSGIYDIGLEIDTPGITIDGISIYFDGEYTYATWIGDNSPQFNIRNNIWYSSKTRGNCHGIRVASAFARFCNNIATNFSGTGMVFNEYAHAQTLIHNNLVTKCGTGMLGGSYSCQGFYFNNISIGNTTNWGTQPSAIQDGNYNAGLSANAKWHVDPETSITIATTDFVDYTNNNYAPASSTSPQVNTGLAVYGGYQFDMKDKPRPAFKSNGSGGWEPATTWCLGPIEYDYGGPVALVSITLQNIADGSAWWVYNSTSSALISSGTQSGTGSVVVSNVEYNGSNQTILIRVRKSSATPKYKDYQSNATLTSSGASVWVSQVPDDLAA